MTPSSPGRLSPFDVKVSGKADKREVSLFNSSEGRKRRSGVELNSWKSAGAFFIVAFDQLFIRHPRFYQRILCLFSNSFVLCKKL